MNDYIVPIIVAIVTTGLPGIIALVAQIVQSKKVKADATDVITEAAKKAVELIRSQFDVLQTEYDDLNKRLNALQMQHNNLQIQHNDLQMQHNRVVQEFEEVLVGAHRLKGQVIELNAVPVYHPPERKNKLDV